MGCIFIILRSVFSLVLGIVVFFGFLAFVLKDNFTDRLFEADFYTSTIVGENTYERIYDQVLVDKELADTTRDLLGDIQVVNQLEIVDLLRKIVPPEYLQSQVEGSIQRTVEYFNEERDTLELYIEVGPPLDNVKPVLFEYINQRIESLPVETPSVPRCDVEVMNQVAGSYNTIFRGLGRGEVPESIPSFEAIAPLCRGPIFEIVFELLVEDADLSPRMRQGLQESKARIRNEFIEGDTLGVWTEVAPAVATPLMDDALDRIREELDENDRLDLIQRIVSWNDDLTESELRSDIDRTRDVITLGRRFGTAIAFAMLIGGTILLGLVHYPSLKNGLRWTGLTLLLTGVVFFVGAKVLESQVPDRLEDLVERGADQVTEIPPSVTDLGGDLLVSFGTQLTDGLAGPSLTLLIIGALMFAVSFVIALLGPPAMLLRLTRFVTSPLILLLRRPFRRRQGQGPQASSQAQPAADEIEGGSTAP